MSFFVILLSTSISTTILTKHIGHAFARQQFQSQF
jgi:hypothetical protein